MSVNGCSTFLTCEQKSAIYKTSSAPGREHTALSFFKKFSNAPLSPAASPDANTF